MQQKIAELIEKKMILSAHDISEGGLFITLIESSFHYNLGFDVVAHNSNLRKDAYWFGESQSRVVVSVAPDKAADFKKLLGAHPYEELGFVTSGPIEVDGMEWGNVLSWKQKYDVAIENLLAPYENKHALSDL